MGEHVAFTPEEETARDAEEAAWAAGENDRAMEALRQERNAKLAETDWMATSDYTMSDPWKTYRQALRDLPANTADPANPTWPEEPS
tara:strand:- start:149 stop:409 length:261 start_codon:yes stop_codon:yes gene_type:complete